MLMAAPLVFLACGREPDAAPATDADGTAPPATQTPGDLDFCRGLFRGLQLRG